MPDPGGRARIEALHLCHVPASPLLSPPCRQASLETCRRRSCCCSPPLIKGQELRSKRLLLRWGCPCSPCRPRVPRRRGRLGPDDLAGVAVALNNAQARRLSTLPPWRPAVAGGPRAGRPLFQHRGAGGEGGLAAAGQRGCRWHAARGATLVFGAGRWRGPESDHRRCRLVPTASSFSGNQPVELCCCLPKARAQFPSARQVLALPAELETKAKGNGTGKPSRPAACPLGLAHRTRGQQWDPTGGFIQRSWAVDTPLPEHFELLRIGLKQVEVCLELQRIHPHPTTQPAPPVGAVIAGWEEKRLNPWNAPGLGFEVPAECLRASGRWPPANGRTGEQPGQGGGDCPCSVNTKLPSRTGVCGSAAETMRPAAMATQAAC